MEPISDYPEQKPKPPYWVGLLCVIPLLGFFVGVGILLSSIFKYKDKWYTLIGIGGIVFTILVYGMMFHEMRPGGAFSSNAIPLSKMELGNLIKDIEYYKLEHGTYPDSLEQLNGQIGTVDTDDPISFGNFTPFNYKKTDSGYIVFSSGMDGKAGTKDDIYPNQLKDSSR